MPGREAVMVAVPGVLPVTVPFWSTDAIFDLDDFQVTLLEDLPDALRRYVFSV